MTTGQTFGPLTASDGTTFRLWAPGANTARLVLDEPIPMERRGEWFSVFVKGAGAGTRYRFEIDGELRIADPASRYQPMDVAGPSEVIDHRYSWSCTDWRGRPWHEAVFYELHTGTFTPEGTFRAAIDKLDHLAAAGITAIELMPLADFPGRWNWGYDGVLWFAPDSRYGRPDDLKALIDAAHQCGLMVFLDVVYNHFGPEGNYLGRIAPQFFCDKHTPWGGAIDYRVAEVRRFAVENAVAWLRDYRFDGLRLDAVHAIVEPGNPHILEEISSGVGQLARETGRHIHLVLENDDNCARWLAPGEDPPNGHYRAQWNDDFHHAFHVQLTGEKHGYYKDYRESPRHAARTLAEGFAYQGEPSPNREGKPRGEPSRQLPPLAFVNFLQNHDQIGNRPFGERLSELAPRRALETALGVLLLTPSPPLLFMGEEWGSRAPFAFFCDFQGELADAVRNGRKKEFAEIYAASGDRIPDPLAEDTFRHAKLDWDETSNAGAPRLTFVSRLLAARRDHIVPILASLIGARANASFTGGLLNARWESDTQAYTLIANFSDQPLQSKWPRWETRVWGTPEKDLPAWSICAGIGPL